MALSRLAYLFGRYYNGLATSQERDEFMGRVENEEPEIKQLIDNAIEGQEPELAMDESVAASILGSILEAGRAREEAPVITLPPAEERRRPWVRYVAAAAVIIAIGLTTFFWLNSKKEAPVTGQLPKEQRFKNDIAPGSDRAILTLADGSQILLDSAAKGVLAKQGGIEAIKTGEGQLVYEGSSLTSDVSRLTYHTVSTPRGGQYHLTLSDGTGVWLNAASSLRFPTAFPGKDRVVEISGEAYFEVAPAYAIAAAGKAQRKPFKVKVNDMEVEVLGTHFNINSYEDEESIKTTLLEGSVRVTNGAANVVIKPGQQAALIDDSRSTAGASAKEVLTIHDGADLEAVMAWKDGRFLFRSTDIRSLMRQLSRWYDVDIVYQDLPATGFNARISRQTPISNILKALELTGEVKFKIEGKKVTVMK